MKRVIIGVTGASGSILSKRIIEYLCAHDVELHLIITDNGGRVFAYETGDNWESFLDNILPANPNVYWCANDDLFASVASGSYPVDAMIVVPCSMSTAGRIAHGTGDNLLCRAADVCIKEQRKLILVPRETPLSTIHLENLTKLSRYGAMIVPPMPSFYNKPESWDDTVDGIAGRILASAGFENNLYKTWGEI